jgi:hypothetical protein
LEGNADRLSARRFHSRIVDLASGSPLLKGAFRFTWNIALRALCEKVAESRTERDPVPTPSARPLEVTAELRTQRRNHPAGLPAQWETLKSKSLPDSAEPLYIRHANPLLMVVLTIAQSVS